MGSHFNSHLSKKERSKEQRTKIFMRNRKIKERRASTKKNHRVGMDSDKVPMNTICTEIVDQKREQEFTMNEEAFHEYMYRFAYTTKAYVQTVQIGDDILHFIEDDGVHTKEEYMKAKARFHHLVKMICV